MWKTKNNLLIEYNEMEDSHLLKAISVIKKKISNRAKEQGNIYVQINALQNQISVLNRNLENEVAKEKHLQKLLNELITEGKNRNVFRNEDQKLVYTDAKTNENLLEIETINMTIKSKRKKKPS